MGTAPTPIERPSQSCEGFPLAGLTHSPGGTTLPNKCKPFHPLTNNPYAVQCALAFPAYVTPYAGDEYCILPPPPDKGVQFGVHVLPPDAYWARMWQGDYAMYQDAELTAPYELAPRDEATQNYASKAYTPGRHNGYFYRVNFRGRFGSHHTVAKLTEAPVEVHGWAPGESLARSLPSGGHTLASVQRSHTDVPRDTLAIPPEEEGVAMAITAGVGVAFQLHHFNTSDQPILREIWINVWYVDADQVTDIAQEAFISAPIDYPRGQELDNTFAAVAHAPTRLLSLLGHRHAWTTRFSAWVERADGSMGPRLYESFDWYDVPTFAYNSITNNPTPDPVALRDGGHSGEVWLEAGDKVRFNCHVETTHERAAVLGVPMPPQNLRFANQAYGAEMCILGTWTTGTKLRPERTDAAP